MLILMPFRILLSLCLLGSLVACATRQFVTATLYESPHSFVRLEFDRTVEKGKGHSHPVTLTVEQVVAVLRGVMIEEPYGRMPIYDDLGEARRHPAFADAQILFFAPLLARGLVMATPEEVVTFYQSVGVAGAQRYVTSGGVFVDEDKLHFVLSNYRSKGHYMADISSADTVDDRQTPMKSLAPQRGKLEFEPKEFQVSSAPNGPASLLSWSRPELVILYRQLPPQPLPTTRAQSPPR